MKEEVGKIVKCKITGIEKYGLFVKLDNDYTGLIHISEISDKYIRDVNKLFFVGDIIEAKIIEVDEEKKQIKLSLKEKNASKINNLVLQEKGGGFKPLKDNLDYWIEEKLKDLQK